MKIIYLNGLNNIAPTELNKSVVQLFYYDVAPTEQVQITKPHRGGIIIEKAKHTNQAP